MTTAVSVSRSIAASPDQVWALIADLPRMGEWSPENTGGTWTKGASGPALGAHFKGSNARGRRRWSTAVVVTACEPGGTFGFDVHASGMRVANWSYVIEPATDGCLVTETWTDQRGWLITTLGGIVSGVSDRGTYNQTAMETTLAALAATVEA